MENPSSERCINLFHCLNELNDHSLVEEIQRYLSSGSLSREELSPAQWSALVFVLLTSEGEIDVFDLKKYSTSEKGLLGLLPVVKTCRTALLSGCRITKKGCASLVSALKSNPSHLKELDLSYNQPEDSGVIVLSALMEDPQCRLETLSPELPAGQSPQPPGEVHCSLEQNKCCGITEEGCASLVTTLKSNPSHLKELDLSNNQPEDSGVKKLSALIEDPQCRLETLRLSGCGITEEGCASLVSALNSNPSHLKELDLSYNDLKDTGVEKLSVLLKDPQCRLETLRLSGCLVTKEGCASLVSALKSNPSHLKELDLSYNHPGDLGVRLLSAGLEDPHWRLEKLNWTSSPLFLV
uniref:NACHT LRR and PYD domain-containing protein n=1 Tax=Esox lucius TaxID=8010 RepID=A0A3P8Y3Q8_ESOLU